MARGSYKFKIIILLSFLVIGLGLRGLSKDRVWNKKVALNESNNHIKVKSNYLYHLSSLLEWPESKSQDEFVIGIFDNTQLFDRLKELAKSKLVNNQKVKVVLLEDLNDLNECHIVYLPENTSRSYQVISQITQQKGCLLVADRYSVIARSSGVCFINKKGRVHFEINEQWIKEAGIELEYKSSNLGVN